MPIVAHAGAGPVRQRRAGRIEQDDRDCRGRDPDDAMASGRQRGRDANHVRRLARVMGHDQLPAILHLPAKVPPSSMAEDAAAVRAALLFGAMNVVPGRDVVP